MQGEIPPYIPDNYPYRVTNTMCCVGTVISPDDGHIVARNMQRKAISVLRKIVHQVGSIYNSNNGFTFFISTDNNEKRHLKLTDPNTPCARWQFLLVLVKRIYRTSHFKEMCSLNQQGAQIIFLRYQHCPCNQIGDLKENLKFDLLTLFGKCDLTL